MFFAGPREDPADETRSWADIEIAKTSVLAIEEVKRRFHSLPWCLFE